jgi:hypothetical protein
MGSPKVYVSSPVGERTAGPEALTQFVDAIRRRGVEAHLIPMRNYRGRRNDPEYDIYDFDIATEIPRSDDSILVIPEVSPIESHRELKRVPVERTWLGWFSVNNSPDPRARYFRPSEASCSTYPPGYVPEIPPVPADLGLGSPVDPGPFMATREAFSRIGSTSPSRWPAAAIESYSIRYAMRLNDSPINFFAQSFYGQGFVRQVLGRQAPIITDPIRVVDVEAAPRRRNVVLYNVVKSGTMIPEVKRLMPDVEFQPIQNMSFQEVAQALSTATLYLELGHLPGRDRMPREAAHFGTPVVCLARGAGYCWQDVPLPVDYRISFREGWPQQAADAVRRVLDEPERAVREQESYRIWVSGERDRYEAAIDQWLSAAMS